SATGPAPGGHEKHPPLGPNGLGSDPDTTVGRATAEEAALNLETFIGTWGGKYRAIGKLWKENWERVIPFHAFPEEVRKVIYTTNAVQALNRRSRPPATRLHLGCTESN